MGASRFPSGKTALASAFALSLLAVAPPSRAESRPAVSEREAYEIGVEAYIYFYPLVMMDVSRRVMTNVPAGAKAGLGPANEFQHMRAYPNASFREVVRPNFDTLYSIAWLDLRKEPMIVSAPDTQGRYYLLPMLDMWTDAFAVPGARTSGTQAGAFAVVLPGWQGTLPKDVQRIDAPTPFVWIIGRTQTNGVKDYAAVNKVQDGYAITPLSQWGAKPAPVPFTADPNVDMKTPPLFQVNRMPADAYFAYAADLMKVNPPHVTDWSTLARFKRIGIEPGKFDVGSLSETTHSALQRGAADGLKRMADRAPSIARVVNGWQMNTDTMGVWGDHYLKRAVIALLGIGANQPDDAVYPLLVADAEGKPPMGEHKYVLHFAKEELPPAGAFWSVTMYDKDGFPVANPLDRFAIGDRDALTYNSDGSLDIYIQSANPGAKLEANWLPSPAAGELAVTMRIYAPKPEALDGRWNPPPVKRVQ